ncbi:hypothetical protein [Corynebacterium hadale]|uniref:hypothetical protein n=1 Tax=Corynebacterium hadale TaxID=2026255 RepID=UPI000BAA87C8|nr:hypothetical protein [Corynebacterium hadale]PAT09421.1 hypothetical protein CKJ82_01680 [Corynebacterium hadale]
MIAYERLNGADGVLVVRDTATGRTERLNGLIKANEWTARLLFTYDSLVIEVWGGPSVLPGTVEHDSFTTIGEAAAELGTTTKDLVERMISDGLFINLDGHLIASPHPDIQKTPRH